MAKCFLTIQEVERLKSTNGAFTIGEWAKFTHLKAQLCNYGKGGSSYRDYTQFTLHDVMKHIGVYFINGVSPSPQVEYLMS